MDGESSSRLYKLKFYCQICNKQLKDKDGYNCHLNSNYHKQNIEIVADNPQFYINNYSKEFESGYLDILKRNYAKNWISANKIYQEYISDKNATHMNATKWSTLTGFIKYLESTGRIEFREEIKDKDIKEVKIKYIDNTPQGIAEKSRVEKKKREEMYLEKLKEKKIFDQMMRDKEYEQKQKRKFESQDINFEKNREVLHLNENKGSDVNNSDLKQNIEISLNLGEKSKIITNRVKGLMNKFKEANNNFKNSLSNKKNQDDKDKDQEKKPNNKLKDIIENLDKKENKMKNEKTHIDLVINNTENNLDEKYLCKKKIREKDEEYEEIMNVKSIIKNEAYNKDRADEDKDNDKYLKEYFDKEDPWIKKDLIVRIKDNNLSGGEYYDMKALIIKVFDGFLAEIKLLETKTILRIDQEYLQPIIPKINSPVEILYGKNKGQIGILKEINNNSNSALIDISVDNIDEIIYVDLNGICKINYYQESE